jgi:hypothetical protein
MPWSTPKTFVAGAVLPASDLNTHLRDQLLVLRGGGIAISSQAANDFIYALDDDQFARLPAVAGKVPRFNPAGSAWEMVYPGAGIKQLFLPIASFRPRLSGGCGALQDYTLSAGIYVSAMPFSASATNGAFMLLRLPKSWNKGTFTVEPDWLNTAGGAGDVVWSFSAVAISDGDSLDVATGTPQTSTDAAQAAEIRHRGPATAAITVAGSPANGDILRIDAERTPLAGGDSYGSDALLTGLMLTLTTDNADDA